MRQRGCAYESAREPSNTSKTQVRTSHSAMEREPLTWQRNLAMTDPVQTMEDDISILLHNFLVKESLRERVYVPRFRLRLSILDAWSIARGSSALDIGCGQGESAVALALRLGPDAQITAIDTAPPEYGGPFTVAESHDFIRSKAELGRQICFLRTDAAAVLAPSIPRPAVVTMCLSLWYFPSAQSVSSLFQALAAAGVPRVYIAEYDCATARPAQLPHVLAARAQARLHACKPPYTVADAKELNVRAAPEVDVIRKDALNSGYRVSREGHLTPARDMLEGHFEAQYVLTEAFAANVRKQKLAQEEEILAMVPMVKKAMDELAENGLEQAEAMDIWWAELRLNERQE